ncbi:cupin domain-containing protein [Cohnella thailandensis]|uniref:Cupin domain-containing protein n=1 Tax=Cohnella thailandensis TaxID=557557 RepID=A0A841SRF9_9BACL|nr:cupin domain-containing protein [Cohnella thailandensis]MBB6633792.1 cupin domain-containing protein [Cohnella thailandensis]MBP1976583.1 putative cupin superfamily sugar epimerase [Cohnella thailandensis]
MPSQTLSPLVEALDLQPHVEGGWFREMWKSSFEIPREVLGAAYSGARASASSVYFLLHPGEVSAWHKVLSDELWLYHSGGPLLLTLGGKGDEPEKGETFVLGMDLEKGQRPQALVPAGAWQTATPLGDEPVFVTCIVAPAFHYDDFTLIDSRE